MISNNFVRLLLAFCFLAADLLAQSAAVQSLVKSSQMKHATFSCLVKEVETGQVVTQYNPEQYVTPASVLKIVTTATALELLGDDYRFPTSLLYDGTIQDSVLQGNIYIKGHGDPTLGSNYFRPESLGFLKEWLGAIRGLGIRRIEGHIIADERIFDTEGISMKWVREDLGSYYGAGSYGLNIFDNRYDLYLQSGVPGTRPKVLMSDPDLPLRFHNYLRARNVKTDSSFVVGMPFSSDRYLYGVVPAHQKRFRLRGDIPEPALFLAQYLKKELEKAGITVSQEGMSYRQLQEGDGWPQKELTEIVTTFSPPLKEIVEQTNHVSHNLFADALLKTIGLRYKTRPGEVVSSFERGIRVLKSYWRQKGLDVSVLQIVDGSGLAPTNKVTAHFLGDLLLYMYKKSPHAAAFRASLPAAGLEGSVRNLLKGSPLAGHVWLKSGSMSRVRCYAGYAESKGKTYCIVLLVNNFEGGTWILSRDLGRFIEKIVGVK